MHDLNVLLLDKSPFLTDFLTTTLKKQNCQVKAIKSPDQIENRYSLDLRDYSVFILNLEFINNLYPRYVFRDAPRVEFPPTLGITSNSNDYLLSEALNRGLDDCISYPFNIPNFVARVKALGRRPRYINSPEFEIAGFKVVRHTKELSYQTKHINLSKKEFLILSMLLENPNRTITKEELLKRIWINGQLRGPNTIDAHISNIRRKLDLQRNQVIHTVHGIGYKVKV